MKKLALVTLLLVAAVSTASAQGSGAPAAAGQTVSPAGDTVWPAAAGQTVSPAGEASASAAVKAKHDKRVARKAAKAARKASAASM
jgi:hypothetical protein